jgi:signal transduction histidine kinase
VWSFRDITATRRAEDERRQLLESERFARAEAERASSTKDEFLATLSHELRTPLSAILGWAYILRSRRMSEAELEEGLKVIERNARMQTELIEDLLDMSRITSGKMRLDVSAGGARDLHRGRARDGPARGRGEGHHAQQAARPRGRTRHGRSEPSPADRLEPAVQCDQVHGEKMDAFRSSWSG